MIIWMQRELSYNFSTCYLKHELRYTSQTHITMLLRASITSGCPCSTTLAHSHGSLPRALRVAPSFARWPRGLLHARKQAAWPHLALSFQRPLFVCSCRASTFISRSVTCTRGGSLSMPGLSTQSIAGVHLTVTAAHLWTASNGRWLKDE